MRNAYQVSSRFTFYESMDAKQLFLYQHAIVHSAEVSGDTEWSLEDSLLEGLSDEQMRARPRPGTNSIVWLLWHMARTEDVTVNLLLAGRPQVLHEEGWVDRLGVRGDIGTSMNDEEVVDFSSQVDIAAVRAYRHAVGRRTREVVQGLSMEGLDEPVDPKGIETLLSEGALVEGAHRLLKFWGNKKK